MSALDHRITYPSNDNREARFLFRMVQPLKTILLCIKNTLQLIQELPAETERFLLTVPTVDQFHLDLTPECSICGQVFDPAEENHSDTSGVRSPDLLLRLPCKHIICHGCLKSWLAKAGSCPICRHELTARVFIEDDRDPRTEANSRPILETILNAGLSWLATVSTGDDTDENTFGAFCRWANQKETAEQRAVMDVMKFFTRFSTSLEDAQFQGEVRQRWITEFRRQRESLRVDEVENDDQEELYETDSEDERRYRDEIEAEDNERRNRHEYHASHTRQRSSRLLDFEDEEYHSRTGWWDTDDEFEEEVAREAENTG